MSHTRHITASFFNPRTRMFAPVLGLVLITACGDSRQTPPGGINPCAGTPCLNGGTCTANETDSYSCACAPGWTGTTCDTRSGCVGEPCGAGTCTDDGAGGHTCDCPTGAFDNGTTCAPCAAIAGCDVVACTSTTDGACTACGTGFVRDGASCADIDDCADHPCGEGSCTDTGANAHVCECGSGAYDDGTTCKACTPPSGCDYWICTTATDSECMHCTLGYKDNGVGGCQEVGGCATYPCGDGTCIDGVDRYSCDCPVSAYDDGVTCSTCAPVVGCAQVTCTSAGNSVCSQCSSGYADNGAGGCKDIDDCIPNPCGTGACTDTGPNSHECQPTDVLDGLNGGTAIVQTSIGTFTATAGPRTFVDAQGVVDEGPVRLRVIPEGFAGSYAAVGGRAFSPVVMGDITFEDALGNALSMAPAHTVTLTLPLPRSATYPEGASVPLHYYLVSTATWVVETTGTVIATGGELEVRAVASHFTWYAVGATCQPIAGCDLVTCAAAKCEQCANGYAVTPTGGCQNIDDCIGNRCGTGTCVDGINAYTCTCSDGTFGDGAASCTTCTPSTVPGCAAVICTDAGASTCTACGAGYGLEAGDCVDIDDCEPNPCGLGTCIDTGLNAHTCNCPDGTFGDGATSCTVCTASTVPGCSAVICTVAGASTCTACSTGYALNAGKCDNVNDCQDNHCGTGTCVDGINAYTCDCPDGTFGDGATSCTACSPSTVQGCTAVGCTKVGASTCTACGTGYTLNAGKCNNVDDCRTSPCGQGSCIDGINAYTCNCPDGTYGSGTDSCTTCTPTTVAGCTGVACTGPGSSTCTACGAGYTLNAGTCADVNDCSPNPCGSGTCTDTGANAHACDCPNGAFGTTSCTACTPITGCTALTCTGGGSSTCTACSSGYKLSAGGCVDIDACATHPCATNATCADKAPPALPDQNGRTCTCPLGTSGDGEVLCTISSVAPALYSVGDLGPGRCVAVNSARLVLGVDDQNVAFTVTPEGVRTSLGSASTDEITVGLSIADSGIVAGYAEGPTGRRAVLYIDGHWEAVNILGPYSAATFVGDDGTVAGIAGAAGNLRGFMLAGITPQTLPLPDDRRSSVYAALGGRVIGIVETLAGETHGFVIDDGLLVDVGTLGGRTSGVLGLNARGDVVGASETAATGQRRAFFRLAGGQALTDLGILVGASHADARGIDDSGRITGNVEFDDGVSRPVLFEPGKDPIDIMPVDANGVPFVSSHVAAAAGNGDVVGWGAPKDSVGGTLRCLLWIPEVQ